MLIGSAVVTHYRVYNKKRFFGERIIVMGNGMELFLGTKVATVDAVPVHGKNIQCSKIILKLSG